MPIARRSNTRMVVPALVHLAMVSSASRPHRRLPHFPLIQPRDHHGCTSDIFPVNLCRAHGEHVVGQLLVASEYDHALEISDRRGFLRAGVSQFRVRSSGGNAGNLADYSVCNFLCPWCCAIGKTRGKKSVDLPVTNQPLGRATPTKILPLKSRQ